MHQAEIHHSQAAADTGPRRTRWMTTLKIVALAIVPCGALAMAIFVLKLDSVRWLLAAVFAVTTFALIPILGLARCRHGNVGPIGNKP